MTTLVKRKKIDLFIKPKRKSKTYDWDLGNLVFGDPLEATANKAESKRLAYQKRKATEVNNEVRVR